MILEEEKLKKEPILKRITNIFKNNIERIELNEEDLDKLNYFRKKGGYKEMPSYVYQNNKYITSIRIHTYNEDLKEFWLSNLTRMNNVILELDIDTEDTEQMKKAINRTIGLSHFKKQKARNYSEAYSAEETKREAEDLYREIKNGKGMNKISLNIIVYDQTKSGLEKRIKEVQKALDREDVEGSIFLNNLAEDLKLTKFKNATATISPVRATKTFFPFDFQEIVDPDGMFLGRTSTGGNIIIDHTYRNTSQRRKSNDILVTGKSGSGKSTLVKSILKKENLRGHKSIILDPENEYSNFVKYLGGEVIAIEDNAIINPLEYKTEEEEGKVKGFNEQITNLVIFFQTLEPELKSLDLGRLKNFVKSFYKKYWETLFEIDNLEVAKFDTSEINPKYFPTFDLMYEEVKKEIDKLKDDDKMRDEEYTSLTFIEQILEKISIDYKDFFVGTTSERISEIDNQLISFNLKEIEALEDNIRNAIIFNISNVFVNKKIIENKKYNENKKGKLRLLRITFDEAHIYLNDKNEKFVVWLKESIKRFRKYYACTALSSQSILDFKPVKIFSETGSNLQKIFDEITYKYFMYQEIPTKGERYDSISDMLSLVDIQNINKMKLGAFLLKIPNKKVRGEHIIDKYEQTILFNTDKTELEEQNEF